MAFALVGAMGCRKQEDLSRKSDAELQLNAEQASGRRVFNSYCAGCHYAYRSGDLHGPSLKGVFRKRLLPSGTPANDDRARDVITLGKGIMPGLGRMMSSDQVNAVIAYLHTL